VCLCKRVGIEHRECHAVGFADRLRQLVSVSLRLAL
jgi:hypothetical protein